MDILGGLKRRVKGRGYRLRLRKLGRMVVPVRPYPGREVDVYWLSTGRCGTHFVHYVLSNAAQVHAAHDLGFPLDETFRATQIWQQAPAAFWALRLESFPLALTKIRENLKYPHRAFTELGHAIHPFGYMLLDYYHRHFPASPRLRLVHLVREPVSCCRSMLKVERVEGFRRRAPELARGCSAAERAANVWIGINRLCRDIVSRIADDRTARTLRIEELNAETFRELCDFMQIGTTWRAAIEGALADRSFSARHSHRDRLAASTPDATQDELNTIAELTRPMARELGYVSA